jgi:asparagine synthase (glutamine-hydrolysing)
MKQMRAQPLSYLRAFFHVNETDLQSPFFSHLPRWRLTQQIRSVLSGDVKAGLADHDPLEELRARLPQAFAQWDPFAQAQYLESTTLLPGYILSSQGDRMAMGRSIEGRFPFLDVRVMEFAARLHPDVKMKVLDEKHVLKRAARTRDLVPDAVRKRPKQPYRAPESQSFFASASAAGGARARQAYIGDLLSREALASSGLFDVDVASAVVDKARRGAAVSARDNMAFVFVLSTQLLRDRFLLS